MRRRQSTASPTAVPAELVRFDPRDWPVVVAEPRWWRDGGETFPWPLYAARRRWMCARRTWLAEQDDTAAARAVLGPVR